MRDILSFYCNSLYSFSKNTQYYLKPLELIASENGNFAYIDDRKNYSEPLIKTFLDKLEGADRIPFVKTLIFNQRPTNIKIVTALFPKAYQSQKWESLIERMNELILPEKDKVIEFIANKMIKVLKEKNVGNKNKLLSSVLGFSFHSKSDNFPDFMFPVSVRNKTYEDGTLFELKDSKGSTISSFNSTIPTQWKTLDEIKNVNSTNIVTKIAKAIDFPLSLRSDYESYRRKCFYFIRAYQGSDKVRISLVEGSFFETLPRDKLIAETMKAIAKDHYGLDFTPEMGKTFERINEQYLIARSRNDITTIVDGIEKRASVSPRFRIMSEVTTDGNPHLYPEVPEKTFNLIVQISPTRNRDQDYKVKRKWLIDSIKNCLQEVLGHEIELDPISQTLIVNKFFIEIKEIVHNRNGLHLVFQFHLRI